jgi:hypothetical protein
VNNYCVYRIGYYTITGAGNPTMLVVNNYYIVRFQVLTAASMKFRFVWDVLPVWVQLPDIHPAQAIFVKDKLVDGFISPPVAIVPSPNMSGLQPRQQTH